MVGGERKKLAKALAGRRLQRRRRHFDVLKVLETFGPIHPDPGLSSNASSRCSGSTRSPLAARRARRDALTVDAVRYAIDGRQRLGVASTCADRLAPGAAVKVYVQKAHGFALPADPATPIIMVGPGTGIAPFRSFLWHRQATKARGKAWLFFGHQREATDFFYRDELEGFLAQGR